ncbi:tyrosine-type recombinase/integrase [Acinetobacter radioresistens]|uniref:tyrosine-type recombinase/integrase n=1 Tax=Acinetobacter radioresistens TaxID=40216 RepID=UPI002247D6C3|nr:site-specific integrase [Acinetobacter radioresistens]MCX0339445.1 site-specific integrase [Acinetobacter radioresistens]
MKKTHIKKFRASDSHLMTVLVDDEGLPLFHPNVYVNSKYRSLGFSDNSIEKILRSIGMVYLWAEINRINLDQVLFSPQFLSISQLEDIAFFLRLKREEQDKHLNKNKMLTPSNLTKQIENIIFSSAKSSQSAVSASEGSYRIRAVANFLDFCLSRSKYKPTASKPNDLGQRVDLFRSLAPRVVNKGDQDALEGLSKSDRNIVRELFDPNNPNNPFLKDFHKYRNELMYEIFIHTGIRRNELRHIKLDDISYSNLTLDIRVSKTKVRTLPFSRNLCDKYREFVTRYLSKIPPKNRKHNYLFTTSSGKHLSNDAINLVVRTVKEAIQADRDLTPHTLRRTWNDIFSELIDTLPPEQKPSIESEKNIRNRLMGWSSTSTMSAIYARRTIREKADEMANLLANTIISSEGK